MKTYLIINPYNDNATHGIHNYLLNLIEELKLLNIPYDYIYNNNMTLANYRQYVYDYVHNKYGYDEVIIEAPEAKAATLYLENMYRVHIRLHTPSSVAQKYDGKDINQQSFSDEIRVIQKAKIVSSPSYGLLKELKSELILDNTFIYKNPYNKTIKSVQKKEYDLIFMGRFQPLKGIEYINSILEKLPQNFKVLLVGNNSHTIRLTTNIQCDVKVCEHIDNSSRFDLISKAKTLMLLSKFENCSMVILEALASRTIVNAWNVGGNGEIATEKVLKIIPFEDIFQMVNQIIKNRDEVYPTEEVFKESLENIDNDFRNGLSSLISFANNKSKNIFKGQDFTYTHREELKKKDILYTSKIMYQKEDFGERIFGFSISNEHIEEMWMPVINKFNAEYLFVSKRERGYHHCFEHRYDLDDSRYLVYDWIKNPKQLIADIKRFKPNKIFFHNGLHPSYQNVLKIIKEHIDIPIIYSELGWYPQLNNIYFDEEGTNGKSKIALQNFESFTGYSLPIQKKKTIITNKTILIITQTENDTNLIVNSKRFKKNIYFVQHVLDELSLINECFNVIIKTHPLDKNKALLERFESENITVIHKGNLDEMLSESKAVIGMNSTVLMEALKYKCNVYMYAKSLLSNKNVVIDCSSFHAKLSELWENTFFSTMDAKTILIQEFKNRQININNLEDRSLDNCLKSNAFKPLLSSYAIYEENIISIFPKIQIKNSNKTTINKIQYTKGVYEKKICKLLFHTKFFFQDSTHPIIKRIWKIYSRVFKV